MVNHPSDMIIRACSGIRNRNPSNQAASDIRCRLHCFGDRPCSSVRETLKLFTPLTPYVPYSDRTAPLSSERCILYIYSTNIVSEYFKHVIYSPFFSLQIAVCFIILTYLVPVLFTFICYVYVCSCELNIFKTIEGAANCEIRSVIRFLNARNVLPIEIHNQICQVYGDNETSDGMVKKWVWMFNEGRENVHDEA